MSIESLAGKLLVAMPGMGDPQFDRSVIFMCSHDSDHAMGIIINKPKDEVTVSDVLEHLGLEAGAEIGARAVLDGGPVRTDRGFVLHSEDFAAGDSTQSIAPGIRLTATREVLAAVASESAPARFMLALGCAGWGAGQLEDELRQNAWLIVDADADDAIVFSDVHAEKWAGAIKRLGFEPSQLMGDAGNA